jgi:hypothetical protein
VARGAPHLDLLTGAAIDGTERLALTQLIFVDREEPLLSSHRTRS